VQINNEGNRIEEDSAFETSAVGAAMLFGVNNEITTSQRSTVAANFDRWQFVLVVAVVFRTDIVAVVDVIVVVVVDTA
jgi:hypothetical protein